jgi:hypothetical protein
MDIVRTITGVGVTMFLSSNLTEALNYIIAILLTIDSVWTDNPIYSTLTEHNKK